MVDIFNPPAFHMGGDEVNMKCYKTSSEIKEYFSQVNKSLSDDSIFELWGDFQQKSSKLVQQKNKKKSTPIILWSSGLTSRTNVTEILPTDEYIIQFWDKIHSESFEELLKNDYKIIVSNTDAWYLDCGFANWVTDGSNWCSPYKGK